MEKSDAIIFKVAPYSETTLLLTLLTREHGMVRVLAKGVRRGKSSTLAAYEPFAWIHASLRLKSPDGLGAIFGAELEDGWAYLRHDMERLAFAGLGIEVLGGLAAHSPDESDYFEEAVTFLKALERVEGPGSLTIALLLRLLHLAGFPPQLAEPWVPETLPSGLTYHFDRGLFDRPQTSDSMHTMRLSKAALAPILGALYSPPALDGSLVIAPQAGVHVLRWLIRVWEDHLSSQFKSARFLEKMILRPRASR